MKPISTEEVKKIELDILSYVANFCDKNGLEYGLGFGTLIGAIRHNGFIPWDDDVDICMKREDYNKLIELFNKANKDNLTYRLISPYDKGAKHSFVKIIDTRTVKKEFGISDKRSKLGVDVDVFPIDGVPENEEEYKVWYEKLISIYKRHYDCVESFHGGLLTRIKILIKKILLVLSGNTKNRVLKKADRLHKAYPIGRSSFVRSVESQYAEKGGKVKKECYEGTVLVDFEGAKFKAPQGYDEILRSIYGDYMELPPEEKRVTHHVNSVYWK